MGPTQGEGGQHPERGDNPPTATTAGATTSSQFPAPGRCGRGPERDGQTQGGGRPLERGPGPCPRPPGGATKFTQRGLGPTQGAGADSQTGGLTPLVATSSIQLPAPRRRGKRATRGHHYIQPALCTCWGNPGGATSSSQLPVPAIERNSNDSFDSLWDNEWHFCSFFIISENELFGKYRLRKCYTLCSEIIFIS